MALTLTETRRVFEDGQMFGLALVPEEAWRCAYVRDREAVVSVNSLAFVCVSQTTKTCVQVCVL